MQNNFIELQDVKVTYYPDSRNLQAVRGVNLAIKQGETLGIVGESGSGKSVTASTILKLKEVNRKESGKVFFKGKNLDSLSKKELLKFRRESLGFISQEPSLSFDPIYSIYKCFEEKFRLTEPKIKKAEVTERACELLESVEISNPAERLKNYPHQFSGGMLQRILIALALANNPEILIADEPTTSLDVTIQRRIVALLKKLQKERNLTMIFISHDISLVSEVSDKIAVMYGGLILEYGEESAVLKQQLSPYTEELMKSMPSPGEHYSTAPLHTIPGTVPDPVAPPPGCPFAPRCTLAKETCVNTIPELIETSDGHKYRCILERHK